MKPMVDTPHKRERTKAPTEISTAVMAYPISSYSHALGNKWAPVDEPGKLSHPRRIKVSSVNQLLGFDLSVG